MFSVCLCRLCAGDAGSPGRHRPEGLSAPREDRTHRPHCDHMIPPPHCLHSPSATGYLRSLGGEAAPECCPGFSSWSLLETELDGKVKEQVEYEKIHEELSIYLPLPLSSVWLERVFLKEKGRKSIWGIRYMIFINVTLGKQNIKIQKWTEVCLM